MLFYMGDTGIAEKAFALQFTLKVAGIFFPKIFLSHTVHFPLQ